ncbi:MAG: HlyD family efflux transporter periplasmic adaptor subunit [Cyclobacteriaceae bacterium]|nr:HlyD family efflux transporter periplasmic adaptor subunit [Cyclobacteriaceae bacterium]
MKRINIFIIFWVLTGSILLIISFHFRRQSDAIVAQVEPEKIAVSFQKPVKIKAMYVMPGQEVMKGELLMELERPDLLYDINVVSNQMNSVLQEKSMVMDNIDAQIQLAKLESLSETKEIEEEISLMKARLKQTKDIISSFEAMDAESKERVREQTNLTELKIQVLERQKDQILSIYNQKIRQLEDRKNNEMDIYDLRQERLQQEENLLTQEITYLQNYAPISGTIGDIFAQEGELISPYETILSIYERHPKIIKAYMNERNRYELNVNDEVWVESSNRKYRITGKVMEIGSRITSYPARLLIDQEMRFWGQEIFVEIPPDNQFLNGEKVFVRLK